MAKFNSRHYYGKVQNRRHGERREKGMEREVEIVVERCSHFKKKKRLKIKRKKKRNAFIHNIYIRKIYNMLEKTTSCPTFLIIAKPD